MTTFYTFNTLVDPDQGADTDIRPFGQFYQATDTSYQCYNALFGKGNYDGCDPNLELNLEHQESAADNVIVDSSDNGRNGFLNEPGLTTQEISYEDGPTGYLPRSLHLPATASRYDGGEISFVVGGNSGSRSEWADIPESQGITMIGWGHMDGTRLAHGFFRRLAHGNPLAGSSYSAGYGNSPSQTVVSVHTGGQNYGSSLEYWTANATEPRLSDNQWYHMAFTIKDLNRSVFVDGEKKVTTTSGNSISYATNAAFYAGHDGTNGTSGGRQAGKALFSRELSDAEIQEAYSGPEPYAQLVPSISGTPAVGDFVTINAGTWNSQNNGVIRYSYKMYSYSDTNGSDEKLEKTMTSYKTSQKIFLNNSALAGRYLRFIVSAENDGGTDPLEVYETGYSSAVGAGSMSSYVSYNALFGRGKHVYDYALLAYYEMNDNADNDVVTDSTRNGWNGTLLTNLGSPPVTQDISTDGPTSWDAKALDFDSGSYGVDIIGLNHELPTGSSTILSRVKSEWATTNSRIFSNRGNNGALGIHLSGYASGTGSSGFSHGITSGPSGPGSLVISNTFFTRPNTAWKDVCGVFRSGDALEMWIDGALDNTTATTITTQYNDTNYGEASISSNGQQNLGVYIFDGQISDVAIFDRDLTSDEVPEYSSGPEPINITAPSIFGDFRVGFVITATGGTWDNQNNGSVTTAYQWFRADDANGTNLTAIAGATGSTYELSFDDHQKYVTVRERASNDGGYDELEDTFSTYSSEIGLKGGMLVVKAG